MAPDFLIVGFADVDGDAGQQCMQLLEINILKGLLVEKKGGSGSEVYSSLLFSTFCAFDTDGYCGSCDYDC